MSRIAPAPRSIHADNVRSAHKVAEKASRHTAEDLHEARLDAQGALGFCFEYVAEKLGVDAEYAQRIDTARIAAAKVTKLEEEDIATTNQHFRALHHELDHIHSDIASLQRAAGFKDTNGATPETATNGANGGANTAQPTTEPAVVTASA